MWNQQIQTDRTIPNNKPDIIIRDNEKGTYMLIRRCNLRRQKCDLKRSREDSKTLRPYNRNTALVECKTNGDTSNNRGDWDYFKVIQKIREQIPGKHEVKDLQKTAILGTAHIHRKVLM